MKNSKVLTNLAIALKLPCYAGAMISFKQLIANSVFFLLYYLSAAFDTIDHITLLNILRDNLGVDGVALEWFSSYLSDRSQCVSIDGVVSESKTLPHGVPQGSVLGPLLFCAYMTELVSTSIHTLVIHKFI